MGSFWPTRVRLRSLKRCGMMNWDTTILGFRMFLSPQGVVNWTLQIEIEIGTVQQGYRESARPHQSRDQKLLERFVTRSFFWAPMAWKWIWPPDSWSEAYTSFGRWGHGSESGHRSSSLNLHQTLTDCNSCHICCAQLGTPWHQIVMASRAVDHDFFHNK